MTRRWHPVKAGGIPAAGVTMADRNRFTSLVANLVQRARAAVRDEDPALRWLRDEGTLDGLSTDDALAAIEAAAQLGRADLLATAKASARSKEVRKAAGAALHKLKAAGVQVEEVRSTHQWGLKPEEAPENPPMAFLSAPDLDGRFSFLLLVTGGNENVVFAGMGGGASGFSDVDHTHLGRSRRRELLGDVRRDEALTEVPFYAALQLLERAFEIAGSEPHEWAHLTNHVDEGTKTSARVLNPFGQPVGEPHPDQLASVVPLLDGPHALMLLPDQQVLMRALVELMGAAASPLEVSEDSRLRRQQEALDLAADEVADGLRRKTWALALDVLALVADRRGWEDLVAPARHTAEALRQGWKGRDIPFVREITERIVNLQLTQYAPPAEAVQAGEPGAEQGAEG